MTTDLAIDFGTSNTVVAVRGEGSLSRSVAVGEFSRSFEGDVVAQCPVVPSFIHYGNDGRTLIGASAKERRNDTSTFSLMKRFISNRSVGGRNVNGRTISYAAAGADFLRGILAVATAQEGISTGELAFTVPVEAYEHFEDWIRGVVEDAGFPRYRSIDEASAAALGYGAHIQPGDVYMVFDFGGGTLDCSVVLIEEEETVADPGRRCRVLGKAGSEVGGSTIDSWIFQRVLKQAGIPPTDPRIETVGNALLEYCEDAKIRLSAVAQAPITLVSPDTAEIVLNATLSRTELEELLDEHEAFTTMEETVARAISSAEQRGYRVDDIKNVFLVGGTCLMPAVQQFATRRFGRDRVLLDGPIDAVARGAAAFAAGVDFYDHIQHEYALRVVDHTTGQYRYETLVQKGTPYPSPQVRVWTAKSTHEGQTHLGLAIFELGSATSSSQNLELIFSPGGSPMLRSLSPEQRERRSLFWMNEGAPTFLEADPPARSGEERFLVEFSIDENKRLLITARDLKHATVVFRDFPVIQLK